MMKNFKLILLVITYVFMLNSCQKNASKSGFSSTTSKDSSSSWGGTSTSNTAKKQPDYYLKGCYRGEAQGLEGSGSQIFPLKIYLNTTDLDKTGWSTGPVVQIALSGTLENTFNLTSNECVKFNQPYTYRTGEYWYNETTRERGINITLDHEDLKNGGLIPSGDDGCHLYGVPVRLAIRLILEAPEGNEGPVAKIKGGTYTLYYANIQKLFQYKGDARSLNPSFACPNEDWDPSTTWADYIFEKSELKLDPQRHLAYFVGSIGTMTHELCGDKQIKECFHVE